jgi:hypothetical protein
MAAVFGPCPVVLPREHPALNAPARHRGVNGIRLRRILQGRQHRGGWTGPTSRRLRCRVLYVFAIHLALGCGWWARRCRDLGAAAAGGGGGLQGGRRDRCLIVVVVEGEEEEEGRQ